MIKITVMMTIIKTTIIKVVKIIIIIVINKSKQEQHYLADLSSVSKH